jgi:hypothetical protein
MPNLIVGIPDSLASILNSTAARRSTSLDTVVTAALTFDTPGPVLAGVHMDCRQNAKLFEKVYERSIL